MATLAYVANAISLMAPKKVHQKMMPVISRQQAIQLNLKRYYTGNACPSGHIAERYTINGHCCECSLVSVRKRLSDNPHHHLELRRKRDRLPKNRLKQRLCYLKNREKILVWKKEYYQNNKEKYSRYQMASVLKQRQQRSSPEGWGKYILKCARSRAKQKNLEFNLTLDDFIIPTHCPVLGIKLNFLNKKLSYDSPTLDRIDNSRGYVPGNVCVISWQANRAKANLTLDIIDKVRAYMWAHDNESNENIYRALTMNFQPPTEAVFS